MKLRPNISSCAAHAAQVSGIFEREFDGVRESVIVLIGLRLDAAALQQVVGVGSRCR